MVIATVLLLEFKFEAHGGSEVKRAYFALDFEAALLLNPQEPIGF